VNCPSCGAPAVTIISARLLPSRRCVLRCTGCGLDFLDGTLEDDYWGVSGQSDIYEDASVSAQRARFFREVLAVIEGEGAVGGRLLDVGAGKGEFALAAASAGWEVSVVEPSREATAGLAESGIEVFNCAFEDFDGGADFDCLTMLDVIEHTRNPRAVIAKAASCLRPGGLMIVLTPDGASVIRRAALALARLSPALAGLLKYLYYPPHFCYLSRRTLSRFAAESGLCTPAFRRAATPRRFLVAKLRNHYGRYAGNAAFTAAVACLHPVARFIAANKLLAAARKATA